MFSYHQGAPATFNLSEPLHILQLDASARAGLARKDPHGSQSRAMNHLFANTWQQARPQDCITYRDVGLYPPSALSPAWLEAVFAADGLHPTEASNRLQESDVLIQELHQSDVLLIATPMYNYGPPAGLKAWLDNIVRINQTFSIQAQEHGLQHVGLLADKPRTAIILSAHGEGGFGPGQPLASINHLHGQITAVLNLIGITDIHVIAQEYEEVGGEMLAQSVAAAETAILELATQLSMFTPVLTA